MNRIVSRSVGIILLTVALAAILAASVAIGSNALPLAVVWESLTTHNAGVADSIVWEQRLPRLVLIVLVGAALAVAGALMQAMTRNPLADPGILGINAGASLAVVAAVAVAGVTSIWFYMWFAFAGAAAASIAVYLLGQAHPVRLVLAGIALSMGVSSVVELISLSNQDVFNEFRFWSAGSFEGRGWSVVTAVCGFIIVGLLVAWMCASPLNAVALGEESGKALGVNVSLLRAGVMIAITLLAGAATAAVGPVMFIGLGVPYLVRFFTGPDLRWVIPVSMLAGPVMVGVAELVARTIVAPQEIQTGIITAFLGGPIFIAIIHKRRGRFL